MNPGQYLCNKAFRAAEMKGVGEVHNSLSTVERHRQTLGCFDRYTRQARKGSQGGGHLRP